MSLINHKGTIISQDAGQAQVLIGRADSCNSCSHKEHCAVFNHKQQIISVPLADNTQFKTGDTIYVTTEEHNAWLALFWGYILPLLLVISTLVSIIFSGGSETLAALLSLLILLPYYAVLRLFNKAFAKRIIFRIEK